ncbi:MAG: hypothetical protein OJF49_002321 [Ktedonobacterales bacterium]|nr:MAG: hypothetical protein OJF49_002321 [Ktedonobacterales bacterium]
MANTPSSIPLRVLVDTNVVLDLVLAREPVHCNCDATCAG